MPKQDLNKYTIPLTDIDIKEKGLDLNNTKKYKRTYAEVVSNTSKKFEKQQQPDKSHFSNTISDSSISDCSLIDASSPRRKTLSKPKTKAISKYNIIIISIIHLYKIIF